MRHKYSLHDMREAAKVGSTKVRDPQESVFVYRVIGVESGRDYGYTVGYSIVPETTSTLPNNGTKCRRSVVARFFHGRGMPWPNER
jgi:hypothetical protein